MNIRILKRWFRNYRRKDNFLSKLVNSTYRKTRDFMARSNIKIIAKSYNRMKNLERELRAKCTFLTLNDLLTYTNEWIKTFPHTYDIIVGIPRSGLMVASIIALKLAKPLSTPELFKDGHYWVSDQIKGVTDNKDRPVEVLLVDDCIRHEKTIMEPARLLLSSGRNVNVTKAVLMVAEEAVKYVDMYYKVLDNYRPIGEWNLLHWKRGKIAVDMDGVICEDCLHEIDMNEELYTEWLKNARPYLIPDYEIDYIVSCRLEKYRNATEEWLKKYGVKYNELILWDLPSKDKRDDLFASYKRDVLLKIKPTVYWESSYDQALEIWESTRIPTICVDKMISFGPIEE